jgi:hypothetical protein
MDGNIFFKMRFGFLVVLTGCLYFSCTNNKSYFTNNGDIPYTKNDLHILVAAEYIKKHHFNCLDTCYLLINPIFRYHITSFLDCKQIAPDLKKINLQDTILINKKYKLPDYGVLSFSNYKNLFKYTFSPIVYLKNKKLIICQVKNSEGKITVFTCKLLGNKIYFSEEGDESFCPTVYK